LTGCNLLYGLPQRGDIQRYLLYLLRVEGSGDGPFRRDLIRSNLRNWVNGNTRFSEVAPAASRSTAIALTAADFFPSISDFFSSAI
jgi:hypothetical protein